MSSRSTGRWRPASIPRSRWGVSSTDVAGFANTPALLGSVELIEDDERSAIGVLHAFVANQGDAWTVTAAYLDRFVDEQRLLAASEHVRESEDQVAYLRYMSQAGRRVAELHIALASNKELAEFAPEPIRREDIQRWTDDITGPLRTHLRHAEATARYAEGGRSCRWPINCWRCNRPCRID